VKNPFSAGSRPRPIPAPRAVKDSSTGRTGPLAEQFPASTAPTTAILVLGLAILVVSAAMLWWADPRREPDVTVSENAQNVAPVANGEEVAAETGRDAAEVGEVAGSAADDTSLPEAPRPDAADGAAVPSLPRIETEAEPPTPEMIGTVPVAETTEELLALEEIQRREVEADLATPSDETTAAVPPASPPKVRATATTWVNLRAGPADDAEVLMVVPGNAEIRAATGCNWCAVTYDGREGFIYKNFISYE
jgi:hypothetical protein